MNRWLIVPVVAALSTTAACSNSDESEAEEAKVSATVTIDLRWPLIQDTLSSEGAAGEECAGALDYSRITTGSVVVFRDSDGKTVGSSELPEAVAVGNLVVCQWRTATRLDDPGDVVTAEVGGWRSEPLTVRDGEVSFELDTVEEDPSGIGSKAATDPAWTETS